MGEREGERIARAKCGCRRPSRFSLNLHLFYFRVPSLFSSSAAGTTFFSQLLHCNLNTSLFLSVLYAGFWQSGVLLAAGAWVKMKKKKDKLKQQKYSLARSLSRPSFSSSSTFLLRGRLGQRRPELLVLRSGGLDLGAHLLGRKRGASFRSRRLFLLLLLLLLFLLRPLPPAKPRKPDARR